MAFLFSMFFSPVCLLPPSLFSLTCSLPVGVAKDVVTAAERCTQCCQVYDNFALCTMYDQ